MNRGKLLWSASCVLAGIVSISCSETPSVTQVDATSLDVAIFRGQDSSGKTKEAYMLQIENKTVRVLKPIITSKDTRSSDGWLLNIGDYIVCVQQTKEAKELVANLKTREPESLTGKFWYTSAESGRVNLKNCHL
jgi:hypothetical protein